MKHALEEELEIPKGLTVTKNGSSFTVKGPKGEVTRSLSNPRVDSKVEVELVKFHSDNATQREKKLVMTFIAHLKNMFKGVEHGHCYKLKVCASHFPMTVTVKGSTLEIKNYVGETVPRTMPIPKGVSIKVDGQMVIVEGVDKELVSQTAVRIEQTTKRPKFDKRIFQDGIYLIEKDGKSLRA